MEALVAKRERFDYVLVETTGLADPSSIASTFWVDDGMEIDMTLDAIVTVIDRSSGFCGIGGTGSPGNSLEYVVTNCWRLSIIGSNADLVDDVDAAL